MAEDGIETINIKMKKSNRQIYYGVSVETGELLAVEDVPRGLACNCICPACGTRLVARKGEKKAHHFAHEVNKECLYGTEVSVYFAFHELIRKEKQFFIPDAILTFHSNKEAEVVRHGSLIPITNTEFRNDPVRYPPKLLCYSGEKCFQIILNFEHYYSETDYQALKEYGKQNDIAMIAIDLDDLDSLSSFAELQQYVSSPDNKEWIYNRVIEKWDQRYRELAVVPVVFESGYLCLAQKDQYKNVYCARLENCMHCQYCYDYHQKILCIAPSYINHVEDFKKPESERKREFELANKLKPIKRINEFKCPRCGAPMKRRTGPNGVFAGCSRYPECKGSRQVEQTTEQVIVIDYRKKYPH